MDDFPISDYTYFLSLKLNKSGQGGDIQQLGTTAELWIMAYQEMGMYVAQLWDQICSGRNSMCWRFKSNVENM